MFNAGKLRACILLAMLLVQCKKSEGSAAVGICIKNCAQCKRTFGAFFEGQKCADACVQYEGHLTPDCNDLDSVAPFLNKLE